LENLRIGLLCLLSLRYRLDSCDCQCFAVVGPSTSNSLPDSLRDPALSLSVTWKHTFLQIIDKMYLAH